MSVQEAQSLFALHYALTAFVASLGAIQIAVASSGLRGLWFLPVRRAVYALGIFFVLAAFAWFFLAPLWVDGPWMAGTVVPGSPLREWGRASLGDLPSARNLSDAYGGLSGPGQGVWFPAGAAAAVAVALGLSSLANLRKRGPPGKEPEGIQALEESSYPGALLRSLGYWRLAWPGELSKQFARGLHPGSIRNLRISRARPGPEGRRHPERHRDRPEGPFDEPGERADQ